MKLSTKTIREIIELTSHEDSYGEVWGDDTVIGTMDELIKKAIEIIKKDLPNIKISND